MSIADQIAPHLPFLRRYARALTGSQKDGDAFVRASLEALIAAPDEFPADAGPRIGLYKLFHAIWSTANVNVVPEYAEAGPEQVAQSRLQAMTPLSRQALLLTTLEGFKDEEAAYIIDAQASDVQSLVAEALAEIEKQTATRVLIIEDEPVIAMDLENIVTELGHQVAHVAITRSEAVAAARQHKPGLVLADVQLADNSSGIDAVKDILTDFEIPVIFITAFPERFLTGERPEPTYLITKPFQRSSVKAAISQALFFNSTSFK